MAKKANTTTVTRYELPELVKGEAPTAPKRSKYDEAIVALRPGQYLRCDTHSQALIIQGRGRKQGIKLSVRRLTDGNYAVVVAN